LGWLGVGLLVAVIIDGYWTVIDAFRQNLAAAPLKFAFLAVTVMYNMTEAAFKVMNPVYIAFLFAVIAVPNVSRSRNKRIISSRERVHETGETRELAVPLARD